MNPFPLREFSRLVNSGAMNERQDYRSAITIHDLLHFMADYSVDVGSRILAFDTNIGNAIVYFPKPPTVFIIQGVTNERDSDTPPRIESDRRPPGLPSIPE